jgi:hypothetical protein
MTKHFFSNALREITARNELRRSASLPELSPAREMRRLYQVESEKEVDRYEAVHGRAVFEQVLKQWRAARRHRCAKDCSHDCG